MRLLLLLVPVALALILLFLLRDDSDARRSERADGPERWERSESDDGADEQTRGAEEISTTSDTAEPTRAPNGHSDAAPPQLEVTILNGAGAPRAGDNVTLSIKWRTLHTKATDSDGIARFSGLRIDSALVSVRPSGPFRRIEIGRWTRSAQTARITASLYGPRHVLIRVRVDGQPLVPTGFSLGSPRLASTSIMRERGEIRGQAMTLTDSVALGFKLGRGLLADTHEIPLRDVGGILEGELDIARGVLVVLDARQPRHAAEDLSVETRRDDGSWSRPFGWADEPIAKPESRLGTVAFYIRPGHHRLVLHTLRLPVQEFEVRAGARFQNLLLNPERMQWLEVRVNVPPDYSDARTAGALITGLDVAGGAKLGVRGRLLIPGDRELGLTAFGPGLRPHPTLGTKRVQREREVRLTAIGSGSAFLRCPGAKEVRLELSVGGEPRRTVYVRVAGRKNGRFEFQHVPRGRFDVAVIPKGSAGSTILNVLFEGESIDLGTIAAGKGATVEIRIKKLGRGEEVGISADWLPFGDRIDVAPQSRGEGRWVLGPLPAGKIRLNIHAGERTWQRLIETKIDSRVKVEVE